MMMYRTIMDSAKLFVLNVFLFFVYIELYAVLYLLQSAFSLTLPFYDIFLSGIFTFVAVIVWTSVAKAMYHTVETAQAMLLRSVLSELPILLFIPIAWVLFATGVLPQTVPFKFILLLIGGYALIFPVIMTLTKDHTAQVKRLET